MTISSALGAERTTDEQFTCAVCQQSVSLLWNGRGRDRLIPPICRYCEWDYTRGTGAPSAGAFRDRREVMRGLAMAEALRCAAAQKIWSTKYAAP